MHILDSNILILLLTAPDRIKREAQLLLESQHDKIVISMASVWEIEIKRANGKLDIGDFDWRMAQTENTIDILAITVDDAIRASQLPMLHRDPFDRMIIAQALNRSAVVVTRDAAFRDYGVAVLEG